MARDQQSYVKKHRSTMKGFAPHALTHFREADKRANLICNIDAGWMVENICSKPCIYCGTTWKETKISCDRIDNTKGHTKDNVLPCCWFCNNVRGNVFTVDEMKLLGPIIKIIRETRKKNL